MTAKEITLKYLENIKRDLEKMISKEYVNNGYSPIIMKDDYRAISNAIAIVSEAEGK